MAEQKELTPRELMSQIAARLETIRSCPGGMCAHCIDILCEDIIPMVDLAVSRVQPTIDERVKEIRERVAVRNDSNAMNSACGEYNCPCHYDIPFLLSLLPVQPAQSHKLITPETCDCDKASDVSCNVCDGGLAVCSVCGKAEAELSGPCVVRPATGTPTDSTIEKIMNQQPLDPKIAKALNEDFGELYEGTPTTPPDFTEPICRCGHPLHYYKCRIDDCDCPAQADKAIAADVSSGTTSNNFTEQARQRLSQHSSSAFLEFLGTEPFNELVTIMASFAAEAATAAPEQAVQRVRDLHRRVYGQDDSEYSKSLSIDDVIAAIGDDRK